MSVFYLEISLTSSKFDMYPLTNVPFSLYITLPFEWWSQQLSKMGLWGLYLVKSGFRSIFAKKKIIWRKRSQLTKPYLPFYILVLSISSIRKMGGSIVIYLFKTNIIKTKLRWSFIHKKKIIRVTSPSFFPPISYLNSNLLINHLCPITFINLLFNNQLYIIEKLYINNISNSVEIDNISVHQILQLVMYITFI